jgi:hypothetical protein
VQFDRDYHHRRRALERNYHYERRELERQYQEARKGLEYRKDHRHRGLGYVHRPPPSSQYLGYAPFASRSPGWPLRYSCRHPGRSGLHRGITPWPDC